MREGPDGGHDAVVMLASAVVLAFGAAFCALMVLFVAENASRALLVSMGAFVIATSSIWFLSTEPADPTEKRWSWWRRLLHRRRLTKSYRPKARMKTKVIQYGTNQPPSVESVQQIKAQTDGVKNWSPKSSPNKPAGTPTNESTSEAGGNDFVTDPSAP
jgi:hypothetical protein